MITLYKNNTRNITSLLNGFHDCREIKISRKIGKKELRSIANDVTKLRSIRFFFIKNAIDRNFFFRNCTENKPIDRKNSFEI